MCGVLANKAMKLASFASIDLKSILKSGQIIFSNLETR